MASNLNKGYNIEYRVVSIQIKGLDKYAKNSNGLSYR
jgi:hypothetical protein